MRWLHLTYAIIIHLLGHHLFARSSSIQDSPQYDKVSKIRWLLAEIQIRCKELWNLEKDVIVELMVRNKGHYCAKKVFIPSKPVKWGIKVQCLADLHNKYV